MAVVREEFEKHPFNIFPEMPGEEFSLLLSDIKTHGFKDDHPVVLFEGKIIDGWNRYRACRELGVNAIYKHFIGSGQEAIQFVIRTNKRRNLDSSQRAALALKADKLIANLEAEAKEKQRESGGDRKSEEYRNSGSISQEFDESVVEKFPQPIDDESGEDSQTGATKKTRDQVAETFSTNPRYIGDAKKIEAQAPELLAYVENGTLKIENAKKLLKADESTRQAVIDKVKSGTKFNEAMRLVKAEMIEKREMIAPSGKFRVIYADPPWSYGNTMPDGFGEQRDHYPVMTVRELCQMPVKDMAADDAVLFLWVTSPILEESFELIKAWGFKYKASFVWDKVKHVMGHYNSVRHEFLLVCVRGSCQPDVRTLFDSVVTEERTEHSKKPSQFYEIIETIYTHGKKLELFARNPRQGWESHGYECNKFAA